MNGAEGFEGERGDTVFVQIGIGNLSEADDIGIGEAASGMSRQKLPLM